MIFGVRFLHFFGQISGFVCAWIFRNICSCLCALLKFRFPAWQGKNWEEIVRFWLAPKSSYTFLWWSCLFLLMLFFKNAKKAAQNKPTLSSFSILTFLAKSCAPKQSTPLPTWFQKVLANMPKSAKTQNTAQNLNENLPNRVEPSKKYIFCSTLGVHQATKNPKSYGNWRPLKIKVKTPHCRASTKTISGPFCNDPFEKVRFRTGLWFPIS